MKALIIPNLNKEQAPSILERLKKHLETKGVSYEISNDCLESDSFDLVISIGGDGTFIRSSLKALEYDCPIVGINCGAKGVLCQIKSEKMEEKIDSVIDNPQYLLCDLMELESPARKTIVVNDLTLFSSKTIDSLQISCEGNVIYDTVASGLIITTTIGSTGINLSAGGSILQKQLPVYEITPICPNRGNTSSLVIESDRTYILLSNHDYQLSIDGQDRIPIDSKDHLIIRRYPRKLKYIK